MFTEESGRVLGDFGYNAGGVVTEVVEEDGKGVGMKSR